VTHYSTIVLGGGTMGTAAAWELAKRGEKALVLERFSHVHTLGSHSGQTRVIRHAYSEDPDYVPFVLHADELWSELEQASGEHFFHRVGVLELAPSANDIHAQRARESAAVHGLDFDWLDAGEIRKRWPQFAVEDDWRGGFGARAGCLEVEPSLRAMARLARESGVEFREQTAASAWGATDSGVWVETADGPVTADRLVISPGAWAGALLADLDLPLQVIRKTLWWLAVREPERFAPDRLPVFMGSRGESEFYGFPISGQPGLKIADHHGGEPTTAETVERETRTGEEAPIVEGARWLFGNDAITGEVVKSAVCLYTRTPDGHFIIDRHPDHANVVFAAGFSGHGFKFATAVGEHLIDLLSDPNARPYPILSLGRFR
jgi:monomeric sarcosine oxidase